ncbi:MAG: serine hydrolase [Pseudomonadota bacterium]
MHSVHWCLSAILLAGSTAHIPVANATLAKTEQQVPSQNSIDKAALEAAAAKVVALPNVGGVAVGVIRNGKLVHTTYAGEAAPGVPVTQDYWFNTASVAKTLIAENRSAPCRTRRDGA